MTQESKCSLARSLWLNVSNEVALGPMGSQGFTGGGPTSKLMHMGVGRTQVLQGCWTRASSSLAISKRPPYVPCHTVSSLGSLQHGSWLPSEGVSKKESKMKATVFYNLILEVTSYHFCCILLTRRKSLGPPILQGRLHKGLNPGGKDHWGHLRRSLPCCSISHN